jgi:hypothetical protein
MSEPRLIEIVARTKSGNIQPFTVAEIISIDGKPHGDWTDIQQMRDFMNHVSGRVTACENALRIPQGD